MTIRQREYITRTDFQIDLTHRINRSSTIQKIHVLFISTYFNFFSSIYMREIHFQRSKKPKLWNKHNNPLPLLYIIQIFRLWSGIGQCVYTTIGHDDIFV